MEDKIQYLQTDTRVFHAFSTDSLVCLDALELVTIFGAEAPSVDEGCYTKIRASH
jgi:hypothetical protein